jgi:GH18 family chitinase
MKKRYWLFAFVISIICISNELILGAEPSTSKGWITGYWSYWGEWDLPAKNIHFDNLSHIIHFKLEPSLTPPYYHVPGYFAIDADDDGIDEQTELITNAHEHSVKVLLCIGGIGSNADTMNAVASENLCQSYVDSVLAYANSKGYDGIDIDWEFPLKSNVQDQDETPNFIRLLTTFRTELNKWTSPGLLTIALPWWSWWKAFDIPTINSTCDQANLMCYDMAADFSYTGFNAPLFHPTAYLNYDGYDVDNRYFTGDRSWIVKGLNPNIIGLGIPFYGYINTANSGPGEMNNDTIPTYINYRDALSYLDASNYHWDKAAKVPWIGTTGLFITYDDSQSVVEKAKYALQKKIGGVMLYDLENGIVTQNAAPPLQPLLDAVANTYWGDISQQSNALRSGWNIISSYIELQYTQLDSVFKSVVSDVVILKNGAGKSFIPSVPVNTIGSWVNTEGYQIKLRNPRTIQVSGLKIIPESTHISVPRGWSIMAYVRDNEMSIVTALSSIAGDIIIVKDQDGKTYIPSVPVNTIGNMKPGQGYQIRMSNAHIFTYPPNAGLFSKNSVREKTETTASPLPPWTYTVTGSSHIIIIPMAANPRIDGVPLTNGDYIGVFYDSSGTLKCGGYEQWAATTNISVAAFGDDPLTTGKDGFANNELFRWKIWDHTKDTVIDGFAEYQPIGYGGYVSDTSRYSTNGISQIKDGPLPIQLASFSASVVDGRNVKLEWTTITEVNNYGFYVECRKDTSLIFKELPNSFVAGHGTTLEAQHYAWIDSGVSAGVYVYRLRQVDLNGDISYTNEIQVTVASTLGVKEEQIPTTFTLEQNYPNPFNPTTKIRYEVPRIEYVSIKIYDVFGKEVAALVNEIKQPGEYEIEWNPSTNLGKRLSSGVYFCRIQASDFVSTKKLLFLK